MKIANVTKLTTYDAHRKLHFSLNGLFCLLKIYIIYDFSFERPADQISEKNSQKSENLQHRAKN